MNYPNYDREPTAEEVDKFVEYRYTEIVASVCPPDKQRKHEVLKGAARWYAGKHPNEVIYVVNNKYGNGDVKEFVESESSKKGYYKYTQVKK